MIKEIDKSQFRSFLEGELEQYGFSFEEKDETIIGHCPGYNKIGSFQWKVTVDGDEENYEIEMRVESQRVANDRQIAFLLINDYNKTPKWGGNYCVAALSDDNKFILQMKYDTTQDLSEEFVSFFYAAMPTLVAIKALDWWEGVLGGSFTHDGMIDNSAVDQRRVRGLSKLGSKAQKAEEEAKRQEEKKKREEEEMKRIEEEKRQEESKRKSEEEARKKMEEEKKKAEVAIEKEKASENKGQSLLKGLLGKLKTSVDDLNNTSYSRRMKKILNAAAEGFGRTLTPQEKNYVFLLADYSIGRFYYSYSIEKEGFYVFVYYRSREFKNKESAERMRLDIMGDLKSQGISCMVIETNQILIRKAVLFRDIEEGDLIARIQNTTKSLMFNVQKINELRKWPLSREATFRKRQDLIAESKLKIEELKSRVADCEADCARHKRDSYYIQKRADAKADLQKEKLRLEKLQSGVDLDEID